MLAHTHTDSCAKIVGKPREREMSQFPAHDARHEDDFWHINKAQKDLAGVICLFCACPCVCMYIYKNWAIIALNENGGADKFGRAANLEPRRCWPRTEHRVDCRPLKCNQEKLIPCLTSFCTSNNIKSRTQMPKKDYWWILKYVSPAKKRTKKRFWRVRTQRRALTHSVT